VLLLPHGYEGQGPEHSSARVERFLELSAEDNICVANVTTAAQLFHLLRRQVLVPSSKPLVLFTPKRYLRGREAYSPVEELTEGAFKEVIDDTVPAEEIRRVVLATGKVALDLLVARDQRDIDDVAVVRVEQLHPWPKTQLATVLSRYTEATDVVWAQEEPANMGAWDFVRDRLAAVVADGRAIAHVARPASGSPATGSHTLHELEQADIIERALGR
jgi:2-oxoglutarate dehydrogenase complex dehydrogenase (E1) component-like enzyme